MGVTTAIANGWKQQILTQVGSHNLKVALFLQASASLDKSTASYIGSGEVVGSGYTAGGQALSGKSVSVSSDTAILDASDLSWPNSSITADAAMLYDADDGNRCLRVWTFASTTSNNSTFTLTMPGPDSTHGLLRIA